MEFGTKIFFLSFLAYLLPFWIKIMLKRDFLIFWFFCFFFWNFLARVGYEQNSGLKFFSLFLGISHPVLAKNNAGKRFFTFLNFFAIFFSIFFPRPSKNVNQYKFFFFLSFSAYLLPFWLKVIPERDFLIFWFFFLFFLEFSCSGWVRTEFKTKIFFSLSQPTSSRFG